MSAWGLTVAVLAMPPVAAQEPAPPDPLDGPPFVSCHTWAIADGQTGEILHGVEIDTPRKSASTTKMMCAFVVLELAAQHPEVLEEVVTFSTLADETAGSTADIHAGESLPVRECLYGLLLPSGNDAGNALAQHFNDRFEPPAYGPEAVNPVTVETHPDRAGFIAQMNRTAGRLGMQRTFYRSSFGDGGTEDDRTTTARDLLRLAHAALQNERFRHYVSTRRYETEVTTPEGGRRPVAWTNTNRLLDITGYDGVKTGTTNQAGSCLVSSSRRGERHQLVVVLGATSDDGRYVDSRNLHRWGWQQRNR
jgi:D-alanyl-D-alanine carboxypeptidase (penicillin-binding protein 5/6)